MKKCTHCGEMKPLDMFYNHKNGKAAECKFCHDEKVRQWRRDNQERYKQNSLDYRQAKREGRPTGKKVGPAPRDFCKNGHDMSVTRRAASDGQTYCIECRYAKAREHRKANPEQYKRYTRTSKLRKAYGISIEETEAILERQGGKCAICGTKEFNGRGYAVDHDHETGNVRGILCTNCNTGIAMFKDNVEVMENAIDYLMAQQEMMKQAQKGAGQ